MSRLRRTADSISVWLGAHWFATCVVVVTAMFTLWAIASPPSSVPDEPAHAVKAASVWQGQLSGPTVPVDPVRLPLDITGQVLRTPASYSQIFEGPCFAFQPDVSASCMVDFGRDDTIVERVSPAGPYPPLFYALVGWPTRVMDADAGIYWMRFTSVAAVAVLAGLALASLRRRVGGALACAAVVAAITPEVAYLAGSVNPNGLEIGGALALWAGLATVLGDRVRSLPMRRIDVAACVAGAVGLGLSRSLGPLFTICVVGAMIVAHGRPGLAQLRDRSFQRLLAAIAAVVVVGGAWVAVSGHLGSVPGGATDPNQSLLRQLVQLVDDWVEQMIAFFGWADTGPVLTAVWAWLAIAAILVGTAWLTGRSWLAACTVTLTVIVAVSPVVLQYPGADDHGIAWQGRYGLALAVGVPVLAAMTIAQHGTAAMRARLPNVVVVLAVIGHVAAFATAMRRYAVGLAGPISFWRADDAWAPPFGNLTVLTAFVVVALALVTVAHGATHEPEAASELSPASGTAADP